jgi:hypothetical protein
MIILAIDPGARESHWLAYDTDAKKPLWCKTEENGRLVCDLVTGNYPDIKTAVAIEIVRGYGIVAGNDTFETCEWVGRFMQAVPIGINVIPLTRKQVKQHLCGNITTNDKYVRQALIDRLGGQGKKSEPGPLYGVSGHHWAALAVGVVASDLLLEKKNG